MLETPWNLKLTFSVIFVLEGTRLIPVVPDCFEVPLCASIPLLTGTVRFPSLESYSILPVTLPSELAAPFSYFPGI